VHFDVVSPRHIHDQAADYVICRTGQGAAPATIRYELAMLRRGMNLAFRSGRIDRRPFVPAIRVSNARSGFFEPDQVELVIALLPDPIDDMARFGSITGWRISEIMALEWDEVDRTAGAVRIAPGSSKNGEARTFPFGAHPELARLMAWRWAHRKGPYVFHRDGRRVRYIRRSWIRACESAGLGGRLFHDLRRSAVRQMERAGVPRSIQMKLVGLKTESIHRRYAITNEEDLARGVRLLTRQEAADAR